MANTTPLKKVSAYATRQMALKLGVQLERKPITIGTKNKIKIFDGISQNNDYVVKILNHSGMTSGGKKPTAKIRSTFADCFFLNLTQANYKYLVFTNKEFHKIFCEASDGLLDGIKLEYIELPEEYGLIAKSVTNAASDEMS